MTGRPGGAARRGRGTCACDAGCGRRVGPALAGGPGVVEGDAREWALRDWAGAVRCECGPVVWDRSVRGDAECWCAE